MNHQPKPAWPQLLTPHRGWLSAVIFARVRDRDAVEEILQETALAAIKCEPLDDLAMSRWLYSVAVRQSSLYQRKLGRNQKKTNGYATSAQHQDKLESQLDPLTILLATEKAELVQAAIKLLGEEDCEVLLLKYTENLSCKEMAERMGVSHSAIKSRLLRARRNLRKELLRFNHSWDEET